MQAKGGVPLDRQGRLMTFALGSWNGSQTRKRGEFTAPTAKQRDQPEGNRPQSKLSKGETREVGKGGSRQSMYEVLGEFEHEATRCL